MKSPPGKAKARPPLLKTVPWRLLQATESQPASNRPAEGNQSKPKTLRQTHFLFFLAAVGPWLSDLTSLSLSSLICKVKRSPTLQDRPEKWTEVLARCPGWRQQGLKRKLEQSHQGCSLNVSPRPLPSCPVYTTARLQGGCSERYPHPVTRSLYFSG